MTGSLDSNEILVFRDHGHPLTGCYVIVCWHHNWPDCPAHIEVLELSSRIRSLRIFHD